MQDVAAAYRKWRFIAYFLLDTPVFIAYPKEKRKNFGFARQYLHFDRYIY